MVLTAAEQTEVQQVAKSWAATCPLEDRMGDLGSLQVVLDRCRARQGVLKMVGVSVPHDLDTEIATVCAKYEALERLLFGNTRM